MQIKEATPNIIIDENPYRGPSRISYPVFPSARITMDLKKIHQALLYAGRELKADCVFISEADEPALLVPEYEEAVISLIARRYGGTVSYGHCEEYEYVTRAIRKEVPVDLIRLGHAARVVIGMTPKAMVAMALEQPERARTEWAEVYRNSFTPV